MYDPAERTDLEGMLNQFPVPMFAVERQPDDRDFRYICLNRQLEEIGQRRASDMIGKSPFEVMPTEEAQRMHDRYVQCARSRGVLRYQDAYTTAGRPVIWDTTLQYARSSQGAERLLGTTVTVSKNTNAKDPALEDIGYFSTMADMQIENLISLFETYRGRDLFTAENESRVMNLSRLCRTVQSAVTDIRRVVSNAHLDAEVRKAEREEKRIRACSQTPLGSDTLKALLGSATQEFEL